MSDAPKIHWEPSNPSATILADFARTHAPGEWESGGAAALHAWSTQNPAEFWAALWTHASVRGELGAEVLTPADRLQDTRFFPGSRLNFAENLLRRDDSTPAVLSWSETGEGATLTWSELNERVHRCRNGLADLGLGVGDRLAAWMPNVTDTLVVMLAATSLGAVFTSTSPDFGVDGVIDRFGQTMPRVLVAADGYRYGGREHDCLERLSTIVDALGSVEHLILCDVLGDDPEWAGPRNVQTHRLADLERSASSERRGFERFDVDHPLFVLYSSGTTGVPKCIVHRAGGILLTHLREHRLHCDVRPGDRVAYFTTAGWMMWNWLASALAAEASVVLYDGSPFHADSAGRDGQILFEMAAATGTTLFGTSAKFIDTVAGRDMRPAESHDLSTIRTICSTGSPLSPEGFDAVAERISPSAHLASISGGTDLCGCLVGGNPALPVHRGEIQGPSLGMDIQVLSPSGERIFDEPGELTCATPFPSMPLGLWGDDDGSRLHETYFGRFPGSWHQGDFATQSSTTGGIVIHGRSDATLNPGGVRIGTAEITRLIDAMPGITESLVIGQPHDGDVRVVAFVVPEPGVTLDEDLIAELRATVRAGATPRHMPAVVCACDDLPRTRSGKLAELAVRDVVMGREVANVAALANPECLGQFADRPELV